MVRIRGSIFLCLVLTGCASTSALQEKVALYNDDGLAMFAHGDYRAARESFELALELSPHDPDLLYNLGQCHDRLGNYPQAELYYVQCLQQSAGHNEARYALGMAYYKSGRKTQAVNLIEEWLTDQPDLAYPYALDGWRFRQESDHLHAQGRLQQALGLERGNVHALTEMAILYESMGMPDRALVLYERALTTNAQQPEIIQRVSLLKSRNVGRPKPD